MKSASKTIEQLPRSFNRKYLRFLIQTLIGVGLSQTAFATVTCVTSGLDVPLGGISISGSSYVNNSVYYVTTGGNIMAEIGTNLSSFTNNSQMCTAYTNGMGLYFDRGFTTTNFINSAGAIIYGVSSAILMQSTSNGNSTTITNLSNYGTIYSRNNTAIDGSIITNLHNYSTGIISSGGSVAIVLTDGIINTFINDGEISTSGATGAVITTQGASITTFTNSAGARISGSTSAIYAQNITTLNNAGTLTVSNGQGGVISVANGQINTINNTSSGLIQNTSSTAGSSGIITQTGSSIGTINNDGVISASAANSKGIYNSTSIGIINNNGSVFAGTGGYGIDNNTGGATIGTLNNAQGGNSTNAATTALTMYGRLPTNYNIIIGSHTHYGQLVAYTSSGSLNFGISSFSSVGPSILGNYPTVLNGVSSTALGIGSATTLSAVSNGYAFTLNETGSSTNIWNLNITAAPSSDIVGANTTYQSSDLSGAMLNRRFDGGTLQISSAGTVSGGFTITANNGKIDQHGIASTFDGAISNDVTNTAGKLTIVNTGTAGQGSVTLSGTNTHTGGIEVQAGANLKIASASALGSGTLALVGSSTVPAVLSVTSNTTISNPITVTGDPTFNIAPGTTTTISSIIADGSVSQPGEVVVDGGGTLALTAVNTYTGATTINASSTLALSGSGTIASSTPVTNNGTFNITGKSGNVSLAGAYNQGSTGNLVMNFSPSNNQKLITAGAATLGGTLTLQASAGSYSVGRYSVLTANSISGTFANLSSNFSSYTTLGSSLDYDASNVYLVLSLLGPTAADTQASLHALAPKLRTYYTQQIMATNFANMNTYDCDLFDAKGVCVSVGGQQTYVDNPSSNLTSTVVVAGYKVSPQIRIGGFLNQNINNNTVSSVHMSNANPLMGLFAVWNQNEDRLGYQVKIANAYQDKDVSTIREVIGTSEAGTGSTSLNTQSYVGELSYAFLANEDKTLVRPYAAVRYTRIKQDGYTETSVSTPLTYAALEDRSATALVGVKLNHKLAEKLNLTGSLGIEQDIYHHVDNLTATGVSGLTSENFNDNIKRTRPVASIGAYFSPASNQRIAADVYYQQLPFQSTGSTTAYVNYMIGF